VTGRAGRRREGPLEAAVEHRAHRSRGSDAARQRRSALVGRIGSGARVPRRGARREGSTGVR
jgi:hypothetical protein